MSISPKNEASQNNTAKRRQTPRLYLVGRVFHGHCDAVRDAQQRPEQSGGRMYRARQ